MGHAVHILLGSQTVADLVLIGLQVLGQGTEHEHAVNGSVGVDLIDDRQNLLLGGILGQFVLLDLHAYQLRPLHGALLVAQVTGVRAYPDDAQGGDDALFPQGGGACLQIGVQGIGNFLAQQQFCHCDFLLNKYLNFLRKSENY